MALVLKDRVKETSTTAGTGTLTLAGAVAGFQSFSAVGNGNTTYYAIIDAATGDWEVGIGTYTSSGTTLSRTTVLSSSNGGSLVSFAANSKDVFVTYPSEKAVWQDASGTVAQTSFGAITATSAALTSGTITTAPSNATDIVNKEYADSISSGLNYHQPVNYASTTTLPAYTYNNGTSGVGATITANANGALSLGGGSPTATQRVLVKDEAGGNAAYNGIYVVTQAGSAGTPFILTRATDYDTSGTGTNEIDQGDYVLVISGTLASTAWVQQTPLPITVGTTALTFLQFNAPITYSAGTGLNLSPATTFNISNTGVTATTYGSASAVPVIAVNAQGQITSATSTNIAISGSAVSGNISGQAGSVANSLTAGTYLIGTAYNGSAAQTWTVDATSANTASKVVARDSSGNFSAGTITAALSGNATTATTATNIAGGAANQLVYQSASGTTTFATAPTVSSTYLNWNGSAFAWSTITSGTVTSITAGTYLTGGTITTSGTIAVDATSANTASKVVARDASGNFSAGTITATLSGNATSATTATTATTATSATTAGSVTNSVTFNNGGAGGASGSTFNGSGALTVSYNTIGASPTAGSASITTLGTVTTGTWNASTLAVAYGGTGVTTSTGSGSNVLSTSPTLTTPLLGTPTSGNLSNCTADGTDSVGFRNIPQNAQTGSYTLVLADGGKHIYHASGAGAATYTIPANSSVAYPLGTAISFINLSSTAVSIAITTDTMYLSSAGTTGTRTLAQYGTATAVKITSTAWIISGSGLT